MTAPPAGYANNSSPHTAACGSMCPNTLSPPSVPVVSSLTTGTTSLDINVPWPAIRGTSMMSTNTSSSLSSTSSNLASRISPVIRGYSKVSLPPGQSPKDLAPLQADTRRTLSLGRLLPSKLSLGQRHYPEWYFSGLRFHKSNFLLLPVPLVPLVRDAGTPPHQPAVTP